MGADDDRRLGEPQIAADRLDAGPPFGVRLAIVVRSAFVQATLNYRGMQNLGRLFCLIPLARWLQLDGAERAAFVRRHLGLFNSNPFISPLGIGALARLEVERKAGMSSAAGDMIERFAERISAPLGALGDGLFWAAVRPHAVLAGSLAAIVAGAWGAVVLVGLFALWQAVYRWRTFRWGWGLGPRIAELFRGNALRRPATWAGTTAAFTAGAITVALAAHGFRELTGVTPDLRVIGVYLASTITAAIIALRQRPATVAWLGGLAWGFAASIAVLLLDR